MTNYSDVFNLDTAQLTAMNNVFACDCGLYVTNDSYTILQAVDDIITSVAGYWWFDKFGQFTVGALVGNPTQPPVVSLNADEIEEHGLNVLREVAPKTSVRLGYRRNWTVQNPDSLADTVTEESVDLFHKEYSVAEHADSTVETNYPDAERGVERNSLLALEVKGRSIARLLGRLELKRQTVYEIQSFGPAFQLDLGDRVTVTYPEHGFDAGRTGTVVGLTETPATDSVSIALLILD